MSSLTPVASTPSAEKPGSICCLVTGDPCLHADSLPQWSQDYMQLSSGQFNGRIIEMSSGSVQLFRETMDQEIDEKGQPHPHAYAFGIPINVTNGGFWQGKELNRDSFLTLSPGDELSFKTPKHSDILVAVITEEEVESYSRSVLGYSIAEILCRAHMQTLNSEAATRFRQMLNLVMSSILSTPDILVHQGSLRAMDEAIMSAALSTLFSLTNLPVKPRLGHTVQRSIVERARNFILSRHENPPTVSELSAYLKMSRRGLHHAFVNVLNISPVLFLRYVRLHGVRKELLRDGAKVTVSSVACKWGFWHMGMFSAYYKELFGEPPSSTLKMCSRVKSERWLSELDFN